MPAVNHALASAGIIALSVAVAAAIAVYESPELRRLAEDLRRRIAIALQSLGEGASPPVSPPLFNRPEDAEGFLQSRGAADGADADPGVDADEESRRRQREELMYWNAVRLEEKARELLEAREAEQASRRASQQPPPPKQHHRGSTFDDFLREDTDAARGTYVFNTGADVARRSGAEGLVHRRPPLDGARSLHSSVFSNPFGDHHRIDADELQTAHAILSSAGRDEVMSDIYNATPSGPLSPRIPVSDTLSPRPPPAAASPPTPPSSDAVPPPPPATRDATLERELAEDEFVTAGQDDRQDPFSSIHAWAQTSNPSFYSPIPVSPPAPLSEPELVSEGQLTPTDSASVEGSGEDIGDEAASSRAGERGRYYDVMSDSEDGMATPASWTEVGSVVSDSDVGVHA